MNPRRQAVLEAVSRIERLSASPRILAQAMRLLRDPDSPAHALVDLILVDAALTANVIQVANSAYYGANLRLATVDEAVNLLGFEEVYRVLALSVSRALTMSPLGSYGLSADDYWTENIHCALLMQELAPRLKLDPPQSYTAGLLHTIGRLAIDQALHQTRTVDQFRTDPLPLPSRELEYVGMTHPDVGRMLLAAWRFPEEIADGIRHQLDEPRAGMPPLTAALHLALAARQEPERRAAGQGSHPAFVALLERHQLSWEDLDRLNESCLRKLAPMRVSLGLVR